MCLILKPQVQENLDFKKCETCTLPSKNKFKKNFKCVNRVKLLPHPRTLSSTKFHFVNKNEACASPLKYKLKKFIFTKMRHVSHTKTKSSKFKNY